MSVRAAPVRVGNDVHNNVVGSFTPGTFLRRNGRLRLLYTRRSRNTFFPSLSLYKGGRNNLPVFPHRYFLITIFLFFFT